MRRAVCFRRAVVPGTQQGHAAVAHRRAVMVATVLPAASACWRVGVTCCGCMSSREGEGVCARASVAMPASCGGRGGGVCARACVRARVCACVCVRVRAVGFSGAGGADDHAPHRPPHAVCGASACGDPHATPQSGASVRVMACELGTCAAATLVHTMRGLQRRIGGTVVVRMFGRGSRCSARTAARTRARGCSHTLAWRVACRRRPARAPGQHSTARARVHRAMVCGAVRHDRSAVRPTNPARVHTHCSACTCMVVVVRVWGGGGGACWPAPLAAPLHRAIVVWRGGAQMGCAVRSAGAGGAACGMARSAHASAWAAAGSGAA